MSEGSTWCWRFKFRSFDFRTVNAFHLHVYRKENTTINYDEIDRNVFWLSRQTVMISMWLADTYTIVLPDVKWDPVCRKTKYSSLLWRAVIWIQCQIMGKEIPFSIIKEVGLLLTSNEGNIKWEFPLLKSLSVTVVTKNQFCSTHMAIKALTTVHSLRMAGEFNWSHIDLQYFCCYCRCI